MGVSAEDLRGDPLFMETVDRAWEVEKVKLKERVKGQVKYFKRNINDQYEDAMKNYILYEDEKKANRWDNAMYLAHLYIELALIKRLHRPENPAYKKFGDEVFTTLQGMQSDMDVVLQGLKRQFIELYRREVEKELKEGKSSSSLVMPETWVLIGGGSKISPNFQSVDSGVPSPVHPVAQPTASTGRSFSADQVRGALDALRLDGKKTNVKLYSMSISSPTQTQPVAPSSVPLNAGQPPPSYKSATSSIDKISGICKEEKSLTTKATSMRIKRVPGDGSCAFRSIAQGLAGGQLDPAQELAQATQLRETAAAELWRCADEEMTGTGLTVEQLVLIKDTKYPTYSEYVNAMSRSEYAGETEFWLLARKLGINIAIFRPNDDGYELMITYGNSSGKPTNLLWQRGQTEAGNHYDALLD